MCNLYRMTPEGDLERYIGRIGRWVRVAGHYSEKPIGPFGTGTYLRQDGDGLVERVGQWGLIKEGQPDRIDWIQPRPKPGKKPPARVARRTNNARIEPIDGLERKTNAVDVWRAGRRCLVPATWYQEPNWETDNNIWWHLRRSDGDPWFLAGLYTEGWVDPSTGELVNSYTLLTVNCNDHPLLSRLHKPERDPVTKEILPLERQDKRSLVQIEPHHWDTWLTGPVDEARALLTLPSPDVFDQTDARATDEALVALKTSSG